eukprot:2936808-Rhodomonas_salina.2
MSGIDLAYAAMPLRARCAMCGTDRAYAAMLLPGTGTFVIDYTFPHGVQVEGMVAPGQSYSGTHRQVPAGVPRVPRRIRPGGPGVVPVEMRHLCAVPGVPGVPGVVVTWPCFGDLQAFLPDNEEGKQ